MDFLNGVDPKTITGVFLKGGESLEGDVEFTKVTESPGATYEYIYISRVTVTRQPWVYHVDPSSIVFVSTRPNADA